VQVPKGLADRTDGGFPLVGRDQPDLVKDDVQEKTKRAGDDLLPSFQTNPNPGN
jgi:hypothetical protein